jgi:hypothetical protein
VNARSLDRAFRRALGDVSRTIGSNAKALSSGTISRAWSLNVPSKRHTPLQERSELIGEADEIEHYRHRDYDPYQISHGVFPPPQVALFSTMRRILQGRHVGQGLPYSNRPAPPIGVNRSDKSAVESLGLRKKGVASHAGTGHNAAPWGRFVVFLSHPLGSMHSQCIWGPPQTRRTV